MVERSGLKEHREKAAGSSLNCRFNPKRKGVKNGQGKNRFADFDGG
jgi:hypothetical protein